MVVVSMCVLIVWMVVIIVYVIKVLFFIVIGNNVEVNYEKIEYKFVGMLFSFLFCDL